MLLKGGGGGCNSLNPSPGSASVVWEMCGIKPGLWLFWSKGLGNHILLTHL